MKTIVKIILTVFVVFLVITASGIFYLSRGLKTGENVELKGVALSNIEDGTYYGDYEAGRWSNKLSIEIKDERIVKIDIKDDVTFAKPEVKEELFNRVIQEQNTKIDSISGATVTSKAYLKAIEDGLNKN